MRPILSCLLTLLHAITLTEGSEDYFYYSPWWVSSRAKFRIPIGYTWVQLYYFDEWDTFKDKWWKAWYLVEGANYEVPAYLKEENYIPTNWKQYCSPGSTTQDTALMFVGFMEDDYNQEVSVRSLVSNVNSYYFGDWTYLFIFFYNLCMCLKGEKTERTCPNACLRPNICKNDTNSLQSCRPLRDARMAEALHPTRKARFGDMYSIGYECLCREGFKFSQKRMKCSRIKSSCSDKRYGKSPCRNEGICSSLKAGDPKPLPDVSFKCECPPAWQGYVCEAPRNPCEYQTNLCGVFPCQRDPTNVALGYMCVCSRGYEPKSQTDPTCVNINECEDEENNPCLNGGTCHDLTPPPLVQAKRGEEFRFRCACKFGFTGLLCENTPAQLAWSEWGDWSACSVTCGMGTRSRTRTCPRPGECPGKPEESGICHGRMVSCDSVKTTSSDDGTSNFTLKTMEEMLKESGVLWTEDDDDLLNDAFTWSEQQFTVRTATVREQDKAKLTSLIADVTAWMPLFRVISRMTLERVILIADCLVIASLILFLFLMLIAYISCHRSYRRGEDEEDDTDSAAGTTTQERTFCSEIDPFSECPPSPNRLTILRTETEQDSTTLYPIDSSKESKRSY